MKQKMDEKILNCSIPLAMRKTQTNTSLRFHFYNFLLIFVDPDSVYLPFASYPPSALATPIQKIKRKIKRKKISLWKL